MLYQRPDDFFTKDQKKLLDFSRVAGITAWVVLYLDILYAIIRMLSNLNHDKFVEKYLQLMNQYPIQTANDMLGSIMTLSYGIIIWIVLRSISLGLRMIAETSVNGKNNPWGNNNG